MTSQQILHADLLDILFEKRNKLYGAYELRKTYPRELTKALLMAVTTALALFFFLRPGKEAATVKQEEGVVVVTQIPPVPVEQKKPDVPKPPKTPEVRQENFTTNVEIKKVVANPFPPQDVLNTAAVSNETKMGETVGNMQPVLAPEAKGEGSTPAPEPEKPKDVVPDRQPQFPGGIQAWSAFLANNLRSPQDLETGEKRTVLIRFHVAEDGSISNFQIEQSAGSAFDNEVIRVLKKMPKWMPAMQGGHPVSVSFTQPVTFVGVEE